MMEQHSEKNLLVKNFEKIGDGWLVILKPESKALIADLMTSEEYQSKVLPK